MRRICVATAAAVSALAAPVWALTIEPRLSSPSQDTRSDEFAAPVHPPAAQEWTFTPNQSEADRVSVHQVHEVVPPPPLREGPIAPLPPPMLIGPLGIGLAAWTVYRAKKRGGRI